MSKQSKQKRRVKALSAASGVGLFLTLLGSAVSPELAEFLKWVLEQYGVEGFAIAGVIVAILVLAQRWEQALNGRIDDLHNQIKHLEHDNEMDRRLLNTVNQELTSARQKIDLVEREKEQQAEEYKIIKSDNHQMRIVLDAQRVEIEQIKQRYEEIQKAHLEMIEENKKFRNANDYLREQLEAARQQNCQLQEQINALAEVKDKRIVELETKVTELQRRVEELQTELDKAKSAQNITNANTTDTGKAA